MSSDDDVEIPIPRVSGTPPLLLPRKSRRLRVEARLRCVGVAVAITGIIVGTIGCSFFIAAERWRWSGWHKSVCTIGARNESLSCIFIEVLHNNHSICSVPGAVAREAWFHEPPACEAAMARTDKDELEYWHSIRHAQVQCVVPDHPLHASSCAHHVASDSLSEAFWRAATPRLTYLVRNHREERDALNNVTAAARGTGLAMLIIGLFVAFLGIIFTTLFACCACLERWTRWFPNPVTWWRRQHAVEHHLY
jgi:hypothetical protein